LVGEKKISANDSPITKKASKYLPNCAILNLKFLSSGVILIAISILLYFLFLIRVQIITPTDERAITQKAYHVIVQSINFTSLITILIIPYNACVLKLD
jgi:hypothetical protein